MTAPGEPPLDKARPTFPRGAAYDVRFDELAASGVDMHGEVDLVEALLGDLLVPSAVARVLDAGCGTGRVAIELARRGIQTIGLDIDPAMVGRAREKAPELSWQVADLAAPAGLAVDLPVDVAVLAGNVMIFLEPGSEGRVLANVTAAVRRGGLVVTGFQLRAGGLSVTSYDAHCRVAGLEPVARYATWDRAPFPVTGADYAVSVHRHR